ncbi:hypothetical protein [Stenotrophomonas sp.]|uniref:hypothetical protein n=1 Tax=Stenotrophomonas sp. TaxID=69392 RepID=UPI0028B1B040|nr:hypothetical protein [Stenotrophomonas sp.]
MTDDQQRARILLAQEWRKLSEDAPADMLVAGCELPPLVAASIAAITAALRAAPEGWRIHKDGPDIRVTAPDGIPGGMTVRALDKALKGRLLYALCDALLAARPQGVK